MQTQSHTQSDHKVLVFLAVVAVLGAAVRVVRAASADRPSAQPALEHQMNAADSSAGARGSRLSGGTGRGGGSGPHRAAAAHIPPDTTKRSRKDTTHKSTMVGALDRPGYVGSKLDLDVATAAQLDSLPGVTPTMARRIVADRMKHGPFLNALGLRRVSGVGDKFLHAIDTLVIYSGTFKPPLPTDSVVTKRKNTRLPNPTQPSRTKRPMAPRTGDTVT